MPRYKRTLFRGSRWNWRTIQSSSGEVLFKTRIYHPNVDYESGEVCLSLTREGSWKPTIKVADLIADIAHLIDNPNLDTPLIESAAKLYTSSRQEYDANAKEWTKLYAQTY
ncbi:hypothetical protein IWQ60_003563 [Tieghemiomyces parasiticus]|uniref:UBC core domain-containing protein n=1 Tax=Tieghemiomyces parasiticus TaxID=78921 RepID=A0A9W8AHN8_9FUNG|nr:hypothetical protein IWQ60_003563 [Tieghemiomyces parasiticus]